MNLRCVLLLCVAAGGIRAQNSYSIHNFVSDVPELADRTDANLKNPWGLAASAASPFWVANNHTASSTVYNSDGTPFPAASPLIVPIPAAQGENPMAAPTGIAFFAHTVKADGGEFSSPTIDGNGSFTQTFMKPGDYDYHCTIHPFMHGKVVVQ